MTQNNLTHLEDHETSPTKAANCDHHKSLYCMLSICPTIIMLIAAIASVCPKKLKYWPFHQCHDHGARNSC